MAVTARGIAAPTAKLAAEAKRSLNWPRAEGRGNAEFVAGMGAQCVVSHELVGNLFGELAIEPASHVDRGQFFMFSRVVRLQFGAFQLEIGFLGVRLRMHRDILSGRHRHRACNQAGDARDHYAAVIGMRRRHTEHQTGSREDAIVRA